MKKADCNAIVKSARNDFFSGIEWGNPELIEAKVKQIAAEHPTAAGAAENVLGELQLLREFPGDTEIAIMLGMRFMSLLVQVGMAGKGTERSLEWNYIERAYRQNPTKPKLQAIKTGLEDCARDHPKHHVHAPNWYQKKICKVLKLTPHPSLKVAPPLPQGGLRNARHCHKVRAYGKLV